MTEPGQMAAHFDDDGELILDRADEVVVFQSPTVAAARVGQSATHTVAGEPPDEVLTVTAANRTVRYRLGEPDGGGFVIGTLITS